MLNRLRRPAGIALVTTLLALTTGMSTVAVEASSPAVSARQMALGVSMMPFDDINLVDQFATDSGRLPAIWSVWVSWGGSPQFPTGLIDQLHARGITPNLIWEPSVPGNQLENRFSYRRIGDGVYDDYIHAFAKAAAASGGPIILRWAHEPNGTWFPWSYNRFDNTPARYIRAWRHIWNVFHAEGATNVRFMYSPNEECGRCATIRSMYPGDRYVDYVGISSFNWGGNRPWKEMVKAYNKSMLALSAFTKKPVIIAETACTPYGDKAGWVRRGYPAVFNKWPRVKGVIYFNIDTGRLIGNGDPDWRLTAPNNSPLNEYRNLLTQARFQGSVQ
jgi:mannan endo-1,4-beta-mannosidase